MADLRRSRSWASRSPRRSSRAGSSRWASRRGRRAGGRARDRQDHRAASVAGRRRARRAALRRSGDTVKVGDVIGAVDAGQQGKSAAPPAQGRAAHRARPRRRSAAPPPTRHARRRQLPPPRWRHAPAAAKPHSRGNGESLDKRCAAAPHAVAARDRARDRARCPRAAAAVVPAAAPRGRRRRRLAQVDPRDEIVPMSPLRKRIAERLVQAQHEPRR